MDEKTKQKFNSFKEATKPVEKWLRENGSPHDIVVIEWDSARVYSGQIGVPIQVEEHDE